LGRKAMTFTLRIFHFAASQSAKHLIVSFKERTPGSTFPNLRRPASDKMNSGSFCPE
jgi:hypothetical protein